MKRLISMSKKIVYQSFDTAVLIEFFKGKILKNGINQLRMPKCFNGRASSLISGMLASLVLSIHNLRFCLHPRKSPNIRGQQHIVNYMYKLSEGATKVSCRKSVILVKILLALIVQITSVP